MKKINVLIVDDSEIDRYILTRHLNDIGINDIFQESDGESALAFLNNYDENKKKFGDDFPPVVIFLDINMPIIGGFEFLEKFKALRNEFDLNTCVIMMYSSSEREEDKEDALKYDFVKGYLTKGVFTQDELKEKVLTLK